MKKPIIGIVPLVDAGRDSLWMLPGYMDAIAQAGGLGVMLPLAEDGADIRRLLEGCNGVLLTGGHDVSPALYGQEILPVCGELCPARDRMEGSCCARPLTGIWPSWASAGGCSL